MNIEDRLSSDRNLLVKLGKHSSNGKGNRFAHENAGRGEGVKSLSPFIREVISAAAHMGTAKSVGKDFGVSKAHAHNLKNGYITRPNGKDSNLLEKKHEILDDIRVKASDLIMETLGLVTSDKLREVEKAVDLTRIAKDLSHVVEKATPEKVVSMQNNIFVYAPGTKDLRNFEVIDVEPMEID